MKLLRLSFILLNLFFVKISFAQIDSLFLGNAVKSLEKYTEAYPVEKVHLHLDRNSYSPGDTIWFKAYTVAGSNHALSAISGILHVEFTTAKDSVINRIAIPLGSAVGWGDFVVPVITKAGIYRIRAYTNWMRNFDPEYFFNQQIQVTDVAAKTIKKKKNPGDPDVQFFPEGGELINGLRSKVAIKCVNSDGMGEDASGSVIDNDGNEVGVFSTQHLGMGIFALLPQTGQSYKAKITTKTGRQLIVKLPKAKEDGFTLSVNNNATDTVRIRVAASAQLFESKKNSLFYLVAQASGKVYFTAAIKLAAKSFTAQIDKKRFPSGIVQFTLFAGDGEPINERIAFIQNNDQLKLDLASDKKTYATRGKVTLSLKATDKNSAPVTGSFSVSVTSDVLEDAGNECRSNIFSSLLLTSDIKGNIEKPGYYFNQVSDKTKADLDVLMLTQGYHRFDWKQVNTGAGLPIGFDPENSLSVTGYLKTNSGKPIVKGKVLLYKTKGGWFKADTLTDNNGRFVIDNLVADADTTLTYVLQGRGALNKKNLIISVDTMAIFADRKNRHSSPNEQPDTVLIATNYQTQLKQQMKGSLDKRLIVLKEVVIKQERVPLINEVMGADQTIRDFPKKAEGELLSNYLSTRVRGVMFINGLPYSLRDMKNPMTILFDGSPMPPELLITIYADQVEGVQVLRTGRTDMRTGVRNAIFITSKRGYFTQQIVPDVTTFTSNGLYKAREFYAPKYGLPSDSKPDVRATIYWKPNIVTDKDGNSVMSFYNSDVKGAQRVIIEGVDINGNMGRQAYTYTVE